MSLPYCCRCSSSTDNCMFLVSVVLPENKIGTKASCALLAALLPCWDTSSGAWMLNTVLDNVTTEGV